MAQARKTIFSLGGPTYMDDPRVAEAQRSAALNLQAQAQQAAQDRALLEIDAENRRSVMESNARQAQAQAELLGRSRELDLRKYLGEQEIKAGDRREGMRYQGDRVSAKERMVQALAEAIMRDQGWLDREEATREWKKEDQGETQAWETEQARLDRENRLKVAELGQQGRGQGRQKSPLDALTSLLPHLPDSLETGSTRLTREEDMRQDSASLEDLFRAGVTPDALRNFRAQLKSLEGSPERHNAFLRQGQRLLGERESAAGPPGLGWTQLAGELVLSPQEWATKLAPYTLPGGAGQQIRDTWLPRVEKSRAMLAREFGTKPGIPGAETVRSIQPLEEPQSPKAVLALAIMRTLLDGGAAEQEPADLSELEAQALWQARGR